jgi:hypothetical protein
VVACLELYGTALGTWRWQRTLPGLGIPDGSHHSLRVPDGNPPSGVASGYVWFDVMALLVAPYLLRAVYAVQRLLGRAPAESQPST